MKNPKSRTVLFTWIAAEVLIAGWIGWKIANATQHRWAIQPKSKSPNP